MNDLLKDLLMSGARHGLTAAGAWLVGQGVLMCGSANPATLASCGDFNNFLGAGLFLVGIAWAWWEKKANAPAKMVGKAAIAADPTIVAAVASANASK